MCHEATCTLECSSGAVRAGRRFIAERLSSWGVGSADAAYGRVDDILLAASELVTNAVKYCNGPVRFKLSAHWNEINIAVTDDHPAPAVPRPATADDSGGRGLVLVDALAARWGQERQQGKKTVWCAFSVPEGSALGEGCSLAGS